MKNDGSDLISLCIPVKTSEILSKEAHARGILREQLILALLEEALPELKNTQAHKENTTR